MPDMDDDGSCPPMDEWRGVGTSAMPVTDWEDLLLAYLHDPFDKALAVQGHETRAARYASAALGRDVSRRGLHRLAASADVAAAIADRDPMANAGNGRVDRSIHHGDMVEAGSELDPGSLVSRMTGEARRPPSPSVHGGGCHVMLGGEGRR